MNPVLELLLHSHSLSVLRHIFMQADVEASNESLANFSGEPGLGYPNSYIAALKRMGVDISIFTIPDARGPIYPSVLNVAVLYPFLDALFPERLLLSK